MVAVAGAVREKLHRRQLASDLRAGHWSRGQARERQYAYLGRKWPRLLLFGVVPLAGAPFLLLLPTWLRWLAVGALTSSTAWVVTLHVVLSTGTASQMVGDFGERCTALELRRSGGRWRVVNGVVLRRFTSDIDHVAIGSAGIIAVETKWIGPCRRHELDRRVREAVAQLTASAALLSAMFKISVPDEAHQKIVVLWGPAADGWDQPNEIDGVVVLAGRDLRPWLEQRPTALLDAAAINRVWTILIDTVERRDGWIAEVDGPPPQSLGWLAARHLGLALSVLIGFVLSLEGLGLYPHISAALPVFVLLLCAGVAVRRARVLEPFAFGCLAGAACAAGLVLLAIVFASL